MKTIEEIETRIKEAREIIMSSDFEVADKWCGWLVGLGIAKGIYLECEYDEEGIISEDIAGAIEHNFIYEIDKDGNQRIVREDPPDNPFQQGVKEALEWVIS